MTLTGDFGAPIQEAPPPSYPTVFGITFTPIVTGILIAVGGLLVAAYLGSILVAPKLEEAAAIQLELSQQEDDLRQREETLKQLNAVIAELDQAKVNNREVRTLFADQKALDTLLIDLNQIMVASQARLNKYEPQAPTVVTDSSLGAELNNKIKQQVTNVIMEGSFEQTIQVMQSIDNQQNFLVVRGLTVEGVSGKPGLVKSTFKMIAYVPLTPEELAAANPPPAPQPEGQKDDQPKPEGT